MSHFWSSTFRILKEEDMLSLFANELQTIGNDGNRKRLRIRRASCSL
jgi:hypothetical protein